MDGYISARQTTSYLSGFLCIYLRFFTIRAVARTANAEAQFSTKKDSFLHTPIYTKLCILNTLDGWLSNRPLRFDSVASVLDFYFSYILHLFMYARWF